MDGLLIQCCGDAPKQIFFSCCGNTYITVMITCPTVQWCNVVVCRFPLQLDTGQTVECTVAKYFQDRYRIKLQ